MGTGILTMPLYREMPKAEITCLDCSPEMLEWAKSRGEGLVHVRLQQGDVGALPFEDGSFDIVLSPNGFHAFRTRRPPGGRFFAFCDLVGSSVAASMYGVKNGCTDWFIHRLYVPKGYFTPPFETFESLQRRLEETFGMQKSIPFRVLLPLSVKR